MKKSRTALWLVVLGGLAAAAGYLAFGPSAGPSRSRDDARFQTAAAERGPITAKVTATGTLSALVTVQVGSQVSGRLSEIAVDFNSPVRKGQVLARLDPLLFQAALEQARANAVAARGNLRKAQVQAADAARRHARTKSLAARQFVAQADLDTAQSDAEVAEATAEAAQGAVAQTRAALRAAEVNLSYTTITSPIDGIVVSRNVDVGQTVAASFQAPTLFVLAEDLHKMQVDTSVAEADVGKLRPGLGATFSVDAWPGERFRGAVRQIRNAPQTVQNVVTYDAVIDVDNAEDKLKPGMTANVTFVVAERADALRLPNAALRFKPPPSLLDAPDAPPSPPGAGRPGAAGDGRRTVWVLRDGAPQPVVVRPGLTDGAVTELLEGDIRPGDALITDMSQPSAGAGPGGGRRGLRFF